MNNINLERMLHDLHCLTYGWADRVREIKQEPKPVKFTYLGLQGKVVVRYPDYREKLKRSRVYVHGTEESIFENLSNRLNRPVSLWREIATKALAECGFTPESYGKLSWSQKAGCSMCPCSPGFIMAENFYGYEFFIDVKTADEDFYIADKDAPKRVVLI